MISNIVSLVGPYSVAVLVHSYASSLFNSPASSSQPQPNTLLAELFSWILQCGAILSALALAFYLLHLSIQNVNAYDLPEQLMHIPGGVPNVLRRPAAQRHVDTEWDRSKRALDLATKQLRDEKVKLLKERDALRTVCDDLGKNKTNKHGSRHPPSEQSLFLHPWLTILTHPSWIYLTYAPIVFVLAQTLKVGVEGYFRLKQLELEREIAVLHADETKWLSFASISDSLALIASARASEAKWGTVGAIIGGLTGFVVPSRSGLSYAGSMIGGTASLLGKMFALW